MANSKPGTKTAIAQDLGDGTSSITKSIEVTSRSRTGDDVDHLVSETVISTGDSEYKPRVPDSTKSTLWQQPPLQIIETSQHLPTVPEMPSLPHHLGPIISEPTSPSTNRDFSKTKSRHGPKPKLNAPPIVPSSQQHIGNPCLWKAPDDWGYKPTESTASSPVGVEPETTATAVTTGAGDEESLLALDLTSMQREAARMLQASPRTILLRLKGSWGGYQLDTSPRRYGDGDGDGDGDDGTTDLRNSATAAIESALTYKELEMERKRWMLSALRHMDVITDPDGVVSKPRVKPKVHRILSLFDSQATASYLACVNPGVAIYHLSPDPLSRKQYPNVHPVHCPYVSASTVAFAFARETAFSTVNCLPIASAVPSSEIPALLGGIRRVLATGSGGALNMVIIDPLPGAGSATGPALRRWLDQNLIFNLEQQFRCTNPSRNFPIWLQEAGLRARGSIITTTRFQAVIRPHAPAASSPPVRQGGRPPEGLLRGGGNGNGNSGDSRRRGSNSSEEELEVATKRELRSVVGRMLWRDIWGPFVTADRWWWDVPEIVDECASLGTHWEYSIIMACRDSAAAAADGG